MELLKQALINAPVLRQPDQSKPFFVEQDASNHAVGAVLLQEHNNQLHPVAYHSRKLSA